jgi:uncharacterized protein YaaN involved in tellurite resistance
MSQEQLLDEILLRVKKNTTRMQRLESENAELRTSVFSYLDQLNKQKAEIELLQQQLTNKKIADRTSENPKELQRKIDQYITLIDKCMATIKVKEV